VWVADTPTAHLHVREAGRANQRYALLFRDFLRAHPRSAEAYARAKRELAAICDSSGRYADAKDPVCDLIMEAPSPGPLRPDGPRPRPTMHKGLGSHALPDDQASHSAGMDRCRPGLITSGRGRGVIPGRARPSRQ
jgi:hypothetical protein